MSSQTEDIKRTEAQTLPLNEAGQTPPNRRWLVLTIALVVVGALLLSGIWSRVRARTKLKAETAQVALAAVSVVSSKKTTPAEDIIIPGNVKLFITLAIYARTNGYL